MTLHQLPPSTIKLIGSSQIITSVSSVVKELVENAIDAGATNINITLEKHGFDKIEVKDDGCGIHRSDTACMGLRNYTSKISDFSDLETVRSYGFRGEALNALCAVANVSVTTKTAEDDIATTYSLDSAGCVIGMVLSHQPNGTTVAAGQLFAGLPVRRQCLSSGKRTGEELHRAQGVVKALATVHPRLRATLVHNKFLVWRKEAVATLRQSVMQAIPHSIVRQLEEVTFVVDQVRLDMLVPRRDCEVASICQAPITDAFYIYVNTRPVREKKVQKVLEMEFHQYFGLYIPSGKHPTCLVSLSLPPHMVDVNLEPNKTRVLIHELDMILKSIKEQLALYYYEPMASKGIISDGKRKENCDKDAKKRKLDNKDVVSKKDNASLVEVSESNVSKLSRADGAQGKNICEDRCSKNTSANNVTNNGDTSDVQNFSVQRQNDGDDVFNFELADGLISHTRLVENISVAVNSAKESDNRLSDDSYSCTVMVYNKLSNTINETNYQMDSGMSNKPVYLPNCLHNSTLASMDSNFSPRTASTMPPGLSDPGPDNGFLKDAITTIGRPDTVHAESECSLAANKAGTSHFFTTEKLDIPPSSQEDGFDDMTLSQWSRGTVIAGKKKIEGGCHMLARRLDEPDDTSPQLSTANRSVSSQMGRKDMSAFTKFARDMRAKIVQETPGISFTSVAGTLAARWRVLQTNERDRYEKEAAQCKSELRQQRDGKGVSTSLRQTVLPGRGARQHRRRTTMGTSLTMRHLVAMANNRTGDDVAAERLCLVSSLGNRLWLYREGTQLKVANVSQLHEVVTFRQLMAQLDIPRRLLEDSVPVTKGALGESLWDVLMSLESTTDPRTTNICISDPRIVSNGFRVDIIPGGEAGELSAWLSDVALQIAFHGVEDLRETLDLIRQHALLAECRPRKVITYIKSEAVRKCARSPVKEDAREVYRLLKYFVEVPSPCLHHLIAVHNICSVKKEL